MKSYLLGWRRKLALATIGATLAFTAGVPTGAVGQPTAVFAKTCKAGYVHAVIGDEQKCLARGEYCARRYASQYRRYGFSCSERDYRGDYHLTSR